MAEMLPKDREKLVHLWMGPCEVLKESQEGRYTMCTPHGDEDHHVDLLKPYISALNGQSIPFLHYQPRNLPISDGFTVEGVERHRRSPTGEMQWKVKWKGSEQRT